MKDRRVSMFTTVIVLAFAWLGCLVTPAQASVLFEDSVRDFQVSGPVALTLGQIASVCATNLDDSPVGILLGFLQADRPSLLASRDVVLQPGEGACLNFTRESNQPNDIPQSEGNVIGVVIEGGRVNGQGVIVQDRPGGGGCITASVQIRFLNPNNTPGQTALYVPMQEHHERRPARRHAD
jgi:hypothetical protein